ncbi:Plasminogen activator inhibitor 2, macrophage [Thelohanellus kitauei]|uniref:Plasminogen activator inhibitor 2, macrophage n=1 Tax=Thelohanellus kitauei TaxID=669202 RepID=A0A0C2MJ81_THEKT|nr:Plasminogen activator inhibitor 2, macrophage [Thelohanellus kitauei]
MVESINELTLKLANFLMEKNGGVESLSISGVIIYMTLSLIHYGLHGSDKDKLSDFLNSNFSFSEFACPSYVLQFTCISTFGMEKFSKIGISQSAIFYSTPLEEYFQKFAMRAYKIDYKYLEYTHRGFQMMEMNNWARSLQDSPFTENIDESLDEDLRMLIINAYFIRFHWGLQSKNRYTKLRKFTLNETREVYVKMMRMVNIFRCFDDNTLNASIVFVPLKENNICAAIVLPHEMNNSSTMKSWYNKSRYFKISVVLPRFGFIQKISMKSFLEFNQLNGLFDKKEADLTNIIYGGGYINDYIHVSSINVNDSGSHAIHFSNTKLYFRGSNLTSDFHVNRPFIFYLYDIIDNLVLHFSVITDPLSDI